MVDGKLAVNKDESKTVKRIYNWLNKGKSIADIKSILDKEGIIARRGGLFQTQSINRLMQNTHHIGYYIYTEGKTGETVWNNAQEIRQKIFARKGQNNKTQRFYLLRNLMEHLINCYKNSIVVV